MGLPRLQKIAGRMRHETFSSKCSGMVSFADIHPAIGGSGTALYILLSSPPTK